MPTGDSHVPQEPAADSRGLHTAAVVAGTAALGSGTWMAIEGLLALKNSAKALGNQPIDLKVLAYLESPVGLALAGLGLALLLTRRRFWLLVGAGLLAAWGLGNAAAGFLLHRKMEAAALLVPRYWGIAGPLWAGILAGMAAVRKGASSVQGWTARRMAAAAVPVFGGALFVPASQVGFGLWLMSRDILIHGESGFPVFYQNVVTKHFLQASAGLAAGAALGALLTLPAAVGLLRGRKWGLLVANLAALVVLGCSLGTQGVLDRWGPHVHFLYRQAYTGLVEKYAHPGLGAGVVGLLLANLPLLFRSGKET